MKCEDYNEWDLENDDQPIKPLNSNDMRKLLKPAYSYNPWWSSSEEEDDDECPNMMDWNPQFNQVKFI